MTRYNMALGKTIEAISKKEKADRERDERARTSEAEWKKNSGIRMCCQHSMSAKIEEERKQHSSITWTAEDDEMIVSMITGGSSYTEIASALGKRLEKNDISNGGITN